MNKEALILIVQKALQEYGDLLVTRIKEGLLDNDKLSTGALYESIKFNVKTKDSVVSLTVEAKDYIYWVENGRKPNKKQPPVKAILKWIRARGIVPEVQTSGVPKKQSLPAQQKQLAFIIAASIGKKGIKATPIIEPVLDETYEDFRDNLQIELAGELTKEIYNDLREVFTENEFIKVKNNLKYNAT